MEIVTLEVLTGGSMKYDNSEEMLDEIADFLKSGAARVQSCFDRPEDDWEPMHFIVSGEGKTHLVKATGDKHASVECIAKYASENGAVGIGQLFSSWRKIVEDGVVPKTRISQTPGREEGLMLAVLSRTNWRVEWAPIKRHRSRPPILDAWGVMMERKAGYEMSGMMFDPLLKALRKN